MPQSVGEQPKRAERRANQSDESSDLQDIGEHIKDLGDSVGQMASQQYERAHDVTAEAIQGAVDAIRRNPLTAIGVGFGAGFLYGLIKGGRD
jgi:ElaB/YqjD/DUF883 family membrane-anchored ribosome-binding protein